MVDGYGGDCGDYLLTVDLYPDCVVPCPPGALHEGEFPCVDDYVDRFNSGCDGENWQILESQNGGTCAEICGKSCTYTCQGEERRDTDWYESIAVGFEPVVARCTAEFPVEFLLIWGTDCGHLQYEISTVDPCVVAELSFPVPEYHPVWFRIAPAVPEGVLEKSYLLEVCGIAQGDFWGACCTEEGCRVISSYQCEMLGGEFLWGMGCDPDPCPAVPLVPTTWGRIKARAR